jgi:hypothetical protein
MIIPDPDAPFEPILRRALANRTAGFVGVVGGATGAQRPLPIRLQFSDPALDGHVDFPLLDHNALAQPAYVGSNGENGKCSPESGLLLLPSTSPVACPFAAGGPCTPDNYLNIMLGNEHLGCFAFHSPSLNSLRALVSKRRSFQIISGKRLTCHQMEFRLRGKPTLQHAGRPIYYVDLTLRSGTSLEKTLANASGTASRWLRADRLGQSCMARRRPRRPHSLQR